METHPGEGVMKEEKLPNSRKPCHRWVYGKFWNLRGQHNQERKITHTHIHTHTEFIPKCNSQQRSSPDARVSRQKAGAELGGAGCTA